MQEFGKNYIAIAFFSMFLIPAFRSIVSTDELDGVVETIAAFLWPIGIPAIVVYDLMNRKKRRPTPK